jgi:hypothetical protein
MDLDDWGMDPRLRVYDGVVTRFHRAVLITAVVPLIMVIGLRSAWAQYACSMDGRVRAGCCCPQKPKDKRSAPDAAPTMKAQGCCDVTVMASSAPPNAREVERSRDLDVGSIAIGDAPAIEPRRHVATMASIAFARPPPPALPAYLVNCTLLH